MAEPEKLKSGSWCVRVYDRATKTQKRFTAATKAEARLLAAEYENGIRQKKKPRRLTVGEAVDEFIRSRENVLSPSSIRGYTVIRKNAIAEIEYIQLKDITERDLQRWVNANAKRYAPKTVNNQFGLISTVLRQSKIDLDYNLVKLPRKETKEVAIPNEEQTELILKLIEGTSIELPVTIAITLGCRQSEIAALRWEDYDGSQLYIHAAKVLDKKNKWIIKQTTKSEASTRRIDVGGICKDRLDRAEHKSEFISPMLPSAVLKRFAKLCKDNGLPHFTMHGQRHGNASVMLAAGVPDKYAMERLGQSSPNMIKNVYQHLYDAKREEVSRLMADKFAVKNLEKTEENKK